MPREKKPTPPVMCPYCDCQAKLVDSTVVYQNSKSYGLMYFCIGCDAYVACKKNSDKPAGTLANKKLREWRKMAFGAFNSLIERGRIERNAVYETISTLLGKPKGECQISNMNEAECGKVVAHFLGKTLKK